MPYIRNEENKMRRVTNIFGWMSVIITIIALILTFLTTYKIVYVKYFDTYFTLQWCITVTMLIWGINFFEFNIKSRKISYSIMCILIAVCNTFFIFMKVR